MFEYSIKQFDSKLLFFVALISSIGLVMMSSASIDYSAEKYGAPFFHMYRQFVFLAIALVAGFVIYQVPSRKWYDWSVPCLLVGFVLLVLVLIPGIGREVNGSMRWIRLGPINLQSSELAKLFILIYLAGYLERRQKEVEESFWGFAKPMLVVVLMVVLLLLEPDFGAAVVMITAFMGMIFLAGMKLSQFLSISVVALLALAGMATSSSYRMERLRCFMDPWAEAYDCGYQLTQSLIAFGRGEWFGLGLGNSIQKLFYLPEAHTDFVFAIIAEELGFVGSVMTLICFAGLIYSIFAVALKAHRLGKLFQAYLAYGIALVLASQVFINIGVNTGLLPTKGLTLPLLSYGGSSLIVCFMMMGLLMRINAEMLDGKAASEVSHG